MSTPPTGEEPRHGSADDRPTTPQPPHPATGPAWGPPGGYGQRPAPGGPPQYDSAPPWGQRPPSAPSPVYGQQPAYRPGPYEAQQYGPQAPAWQPNPPVQPPRDRRRTVLVAALVAVGLAIAAGVALLVYVLSSTILDRTAVENAVSGQFEEREGVSLDLECDERMIVRPGADYECNGTTGDGEDIDILITVTDEEGRYTWAED